MINLNVLLFLFAVSFVLALLAGIFYALAVLQPERWIVLSIMCGIGLIAAFAAERK